jgi:hypothetical protein
MSAFDRIKFDRRCALKTLVILCCEFLLAVTLAAGQHPAPSVTIPAPMPAGPNHPGFPFDQPPTVVHGDRRRAPNLAEMKKQAEELSKLAQSISPDIDMMGKGKLPKDLITRLKRIDKLSKQLKREVSE